MAGINRVHIGSAVRCSDASCGAVMGILIDPAAAAIVHLAVGPRHGAGRLVPFAYVSATDPVIELNCTRAEFDAFLPDQDRALIADAHEAFAQVTPPHPSAEVGLLAFYGEIAPTGILRPFPGANPEPQTTTFDRVPAGEEALKSDEQVKGTDGPVGRVSGLAVDLENHSITHVLVEAGHLWGKREVAIPITNVDHIGISVHVALTRQQIGDLEPI